MGTPFHNFPYRNDNKIYRLMTPQLPLVIGPDYNGYGLADYPSGTNAIVAVISYTGYDMEDAMILNKSSYERGLAHGCIYKNYSVDLNDPKEMEKSRKPKYKMVFQQDSLQYSKFPEHMGADGLAKIGTIMKKGT